MLKSIALAAALVSGVAILPGCAGEAYVVTSDPPPMRAEVVTVRPGFIYVHGNWHREGSNWRWHAGHYERARANQRYVDSRWERHGNRRVWVEGGWRAEGGVTVR
ncbi:MAG: hypothetical protein ABI467_12205 [Kofleriaceae bacterium]